MTTPGFGGRGALFAVAAVAALLGAGGVLLAERLTPPPGSRGAIEGIVRSYVLDHPEIIPEAMQRLQDREIGKTIAANRQAIVQPVGNAWAGNPNGDVTVVEYLDYNCTFCRASLPVIDQLVAADPKVKVVYRELPVLSDESRLAARYAIVAARQGRYAPLHKALYAGGPLTEASMDAAIRSAGLDPAKVKAAAEAPDVQAAIDANLALGRPLNLSGTPGWVIGNKAYVGMMTLDEMKRAVAAAREG